MLDKESVRTLIIVMNLTVLGAGTFLGYFLGSNIGFSSTFNPNDCGACNFPGCVCYDNYFEKIQLFSVGGIIIGLIVGVLIMYLLLRLIHYKPPTIVEQHLR